MKWNTMSNSIACYSVVVWSDHVAFSYVLSLVYLFNIFCIKNCHAGMEIHVILVTVEAHMHTENLQTAQYTPSMVASLKSCQYLDLCVKSIKWWCPWTSSIKVIDQTMKCFLWTEHNNSIYVRDCKALCITFYFQEQ